MPLLPETEQSGVAHRVPLLVLADASSVPMMAQGRGAMPDLRLTIEALLSIEKSVFI